MAVIINANTIVNPGAMASEALIRCCEYNLHIKLTGHALQHTAGIVGNVYFEEVCESCKSHRSLIHQTSISATARQLRPSALQCH